MKGCFIFATFAVVVQRNLVHGQESRVPSTTTAAELWNPYTWFYPYAIAAAEGYRDYYVKAQKATNELYQQIYATNAFPWVTGNWNLIPAGKPNQSNQGENSAPTNQGGEGGISESNGSGDSASQDNAKSTTTARPENKEQEKEETTPNASSGAGVQDESGDGNAVVEAEAENTTANVQVGSEN